jgi:hypothetical protein
MEMDASTPETRPETPPETPPETRPETRIERDGHGRFAPGRSGNPAGRKPGSRNQATRLREILAEGDVERAIELLRAALQDGKGFAARFVLERLFPKPRDRDIDLGVAADASPVEMLERILRLMVSGEITIDEAGRMTRLIEAQRRRPAPRVVAPSSDSPANDLQTAGEAVARPLNRHERRRAAAVQRAAGAAWRHPIAAAASSS